MSVKTTAGNIEIADKTIDHMVAVSREAVAAGKTRDQVIASCAEALDTFLGETGADAPAYLALLAAVAVVRAAEAARD